MMEKLLLPIKICSPPSHHQKITQLYHHAKLDKALDANIVEPETGTVLKFNFPIQPEGVKA